MLDKLHGDYKLLTGTLKQYLVDLRKMGNLKWLLFVDILSDKTRNKKLDHLSFYVYYCNTSNSLLLNNRIKRKTGP